MSMSEYITWEPCPCCDGLAAVGWSGPEAVEFDCVQGCVPSEDQLADLRAHADGWH